MSNVTNAKTAKSLTDRTSLGNKAISVALSVVLLGFGWPTTSLSKAYAEDAADETAQVESAAATDQPAADTAVEAPAASDDSTTQPATSTDSDSSTADGTASAEIDADATSGSGAPAASGTTEAATQPEASTGDDGTALVSLSLGNASIEYNNQTIALPSRSVTVPSTEDFEFTVSPDTGYEVVKVKEKAKGAASDVELTADASDVYAVSAADVKTGITVSIETKKAATSEAAGDEGASSNDAADADNATGEVKNPEASEIDKDTVIEKGDGTASSDDEKSDDATDENTEEAINQGTDKFDELKDGLANSEVDPITLLPVGVSEDDVDVAATYHVANGEKLDLASLVPECTVGVSPWKGQWYSSNYTIARVDSGSGELTADTYFSGEIIVTYKHWIQTGEYGYQGIYHYDYYRVVVGEKQEKSSLSVSSKQIAVKEGESFADLVATVTPEGAAVSWKSDDPNVATVEAMTGKVTGVKAGTTTITATATVSDKDEPLAATVAVTVEKAGYSEQKAYFYLARPDLSSIDHNSTSAWLFGGEGTVYAPTGAALGTTISGSVDDAIVVAGTYFEDKTFTVNDKKYKYDADGTHADGTFSVVWDSARVAKGSTNSNKWDGEGGKEDRFNWDNLDWHVDGHIVLHDDAYATVTYAVQEAGSDVFTTASWSGSASVSDMATDGAIATVSTTTKLNELQKPTYSDTKTVNGETYQFEGWYTDESLSDEVDLTSNDEVGSGARTYYAAYVPSSLTVTGKNTVEQFSTISLTASVSNGNWGSWWGNKGGTYAWSSSNDNILTVDENGTVTGVRQGTATVTCTFTSYDGKTVLTATHDVEVTASTQGGETVSFFYLNNPDANLDTATGASGNWTNMGRGKANTSGISWKKDNGATKIYDRVGDRIVSWPDGSTGSIYSVARDSAWWNDIVKRYKSVIQEQLQGQVVSDDMVESITLIPYKMTWNDSNSESEAKHVDCRVEIKCKSLFTAKYFVSDPSNVSSQGFAEVAGKITYKSGDTTDITDLVPDFADKYPTTKKVGGVEYTFDGWYTDEACTQRVSLPYTITDSNVSFYAKYLSGRQVIYDLAGGTWGNSDATTYAATEGSTQKAKAAPTRVGYEFAGWTVSGLEGKEKLEVGETFTMPNNNVTITANWKQLLACKVKYVDESGNEIADADTLYGHAGKTATATAKTVDGYHLVDSEKTSGSATFADGETPEIVFVYTKDTVNYTVNYYWNGTEEKVAKSLTGKAAWGTDIDNIVKTVDGYTVVPNQKTTLTVSRDSNNTINIYYYKNVTLTAKSDTVTYDGTEKKVSGFTGAPEGADFSRIEVNASGVQAGTYDAKFDAGVVGAVDATGKYIVAAANPGVLTINRTTDEVVITIEGSSNSMKYDGEPHSVSGYTVTGITLDGKATNLFTKDSVSLKSDVFATASGTNAGTYNMGLTEASFESNNKNFSNVKFVVTDGKLEITKRKVTLSSEDGDKNYDGKTIQRRTNIHVSGDGFVGSDNILPKDKLVWDDENNILPGTYDNKFTPAYTEGTNLNNYDIEVSYGKLTINGRPDGKKYELTVKGIDGSATYDGVEHSVTGIEATSYTNKEGVTFTISAETSGAKGTDAGKYTNAVSNVKVTDAYGNDVTDQFKITTEDGTLTINPKAITITAGSASKKYDGSALTADQANPKFTTEGFVGTDGISGCVVEGSQTLVGSSDSVVKSWTFSEGTNGDNYVVSTAKGTLTIENRDAKYPITLTGKSDSFTYDGTEHTISSVEDDTFTFDNVEYTVSNYVVSGAGTTYKEGGYPVTVTSGEGSYKVTDPNGNDVTNQFTISVKPGKLTINKRPLRIIAGSAEKTYDGMPLNASDINPKYTIDESTPLAEGDEITSVNVSGSQTEVGSSPSVIGTYGTAITMNHNSDSYAIERVDGKLEVTANGDPVTVTIQENSDEVTYDGTEQSITGYKVTNISNPLYKESDFAYVGSDADKTVSGIDADTYNMNLKPEDFKNTNENFSNVEFVIVDGSLTIDKRQITLASDTPNAKTYDGTPLESKIVRLTSGELAANDAFTYEVTGSQTDEGTSDNTFSYKLVSKANGEELARDAEGYKNYKVTAVPGSLTVNPVYNKVTVRITGHHNERSYNGSALEVEGYDFESDNKLYTEDMVSFNGTAEASQTDAGITSMNLEGKFANANSNNFPNVEFVVADGYAKVTPAEVMLKSADISKEYDGTELTNGDTALATESGWAQGEGATYKFTGSQTIVGSSANAFTYDLNANTKAENYTIDKTEGTLTVTNRDAKYEITVKANSVKTTYNGQQHSVEGVETTQFTVDGNNYTVEGLTTENPTATDAGTYTNNITGAPVVKDAYGHDVTSQFAVTTENGSLVIDKRNVTLTSANDKKQYDGTPLTKEEVTVAGDGFVDGEGVTYDFTGTGQIEVGGDKGNNKFTYALNDKTKADNYNITTEYGTLTVEPNTAQYTITISGKSDTLKYNGSEQSVSGYTLDIPEALKNIYSVDDIEYSGEAVAKGSDAGTYKMNLDASKFANKNASFTNVKFEVKTDGQLVIGQRSVTLTAASDKKAYDGTPLTNSNVTVGGDRFVAGEVANVRAEGSITNVGEADNVVKYDPVEGGKFNANNYTIKTVNGTLKVTAGTLNAGKVVWNTGFYQEYYDGQSHPAPLATAVDEYGNSLTVEYSGDDGQTWTTNREDIQAKNYSDSKIVLLRARSSNYAEGQYSYDAEWLTIGKRFVKLVSESDSKTYDGKPLTNSTVTDVIEGGYKGFVEGEGASYKVTGSQTNVGESANTFTYDLNEGTLSENYQIEKVEGKLTVIADENGVVVTIKGNSSTVEYTGQEQSVAGYDVVSVSNELYTKDDFSFSGDATAKGTEAGTYAMGLKASDFSNKNNNFTNVSFVVEDGSLTINPKGVNASAMTVEAPDDVVYNGKSQQQKPVVKDGDKTLVEGTDYTLSYSDDTTNVGTVTVTVTGKGNYSGTTTVTYEITKAPVSLASEGKEFTYNGQDQSLPNVAVTGDAAELFKSQVEGLTATGKVKNAGDEATNSIAYSWKNGFTANNFDISTTEGKLTVKAKSATELTVNSPSTITYDGQEHKWSPTVTDGNTVLVEGTDYTVSYDKTDFTNVTGTITVTIEGAGNYSGKTTRTYEIIPATAVVTTDSDSKVYDGKPLTAPGHITLVNGETAEVVTTASQTAVGSTLNNAYTINWNGTGTANNYTVTEGNMGTLTVTARSFVNQGISISDPNDAMYDGATHKWTPDVRDANGFVLSEGVDYTVSYSTDDFVNATDEIKVTIKGVGNYTDEVPKTYKINKRPVAVASDSKSKAYDGTPLTYNSAFVLGYCNFVKGDVTKLEATGSITDPGSTKNTISITWKNDTVAKNYEITKSEGDLVVTAAGIEVGELSDVVYNGLNQEQKPEVTSNGRTLVEGTDYELSYAGDTKNVGKVTVTVAGKGNYAGSFEVSYFITKAPLTVTTPNDSKPYDGEALTAKGAIEGFVEVDGVAETATFTTTGTQTTVGSSTNWYRIDWNGTAKQSNYSITESLGKLTVTEYANEVTVTTTGWDGTYDGMPHGATVEVTGLPAGYTAQASSNAEATDANAFKEGDKGLAATADNLVIYNTNREDVTKDLKVSYVDGFIKIAPKELVVTTPSATKVYDGSPLTAEGKISGFVPGETATFVTTGTQTAVGESENGYRIDWDDNAKQSNYVISETLGTLIVSAQSINPDDPNKDQYTGLLIDYPQNIVYDGTAHKWSPTVTDKNGNALVEGVDYDVTYSTDDFTNVTGTITVTIAAKGNYTGTVTREYEITPATLTVVTPTKSKVYDGTPLTAEGTIAGFVEVGGVAETATFTTTGTQTEVGNTLNSYTLEWDGTAQERNYTVEETVGTLTVTENADAIVVTTTGGMFTYDGAPHGATNVEVSELPEGYTLDHAASTTTATNVDDGMQTVTADDLVIRNVAGENVTARLNIQYVDDTIQVTPAPLKITTGSASKYYDGTPLTNNELKVEGIVEGDQLIGKTTGSQTEIGQSGNTYELSGDSWNHGNYLVTEETLGKLTVYQYVPPTPTPDPDNPNPPTPDPDNPDNPSPTPDPDTPVTPDNPSTPDSPSNPDNPSTPTSPDNPSTPDNPSEPGASETPAAPATPANTVVNTIAETLENVYEAATGDTDADEGVQQEERIYDAENPLGVEKSTPNRCWVHWYLLLGTIATLVYGTVVSVRRRRMTQKLEKEMNAVLSGAKEGSDE